MSSSLNYNSSGIARDRSEIVQIFEIPHLQNDLTMNLIWKTTITIAVMMQCLSKKSERINALIYSKLF